MLLSAATFCQSAAPFLYFFLNRIAYFPYVYHAFLVSACEGRGVGEAPMKPLTSTRKNRTTLCTRPIANGDYVGEDRSTTKHFIHAGGLIPGDIDTDFLHGRYHKGIQITRLQPSAVSLEKLRGNVVKKRLSHLAAGTVVNANE